MTNVKVTFACRAIYDRNPFQKVRLFLRLAACPFRKLHPAQIRIAAVAKLEDVSSKSR